MGDLPETLCMSEYPDMKELKTHIHNTKIYAQDRLRLHRYLQNKVGNKIEIEYTRKKFNEVPYGRYFPTQGHILSATFQWRKIRASLFAQTHDDIDIVNCHPTLLEQLYKKHTGKETPYLTEYINNRANVIDSCYITPEAIERYNATKSDQLTKRDLVKTLFTIIIYGGSVETFARQFEFTQDDYKLPEFFYRFNQEVREIGAELLEVQDPYIRQLVANFRQERGEDARNNALLSLILQDIEAYVVVCAMNEFKKLTRAEITAYTYDGFMAIKTPNVDAICAEISTRVKALTGYDVKFISKPFCEPLGEPENIPARLFSRENTLSISDYDDFDDDADPSKLYVFLMETCAFIYNSGKSMWALREYNNGEISFALVPSESLKSTLMDYVIPRKVDKKIINIELSSKIREIKPLLKYKRLDFVPYLSEYTAPRNTFNLFTGFKHANGAAVQVDMAIIDPVLRHIREIWCADDAVAYEYVINWLAHIIQKPAEKMGVAILLKSSTHGTGKGIMCEFLMTHVIGRKYATSLDNSEQIFNKFNSVMENKLLTVLDEIADSGAFHALHDRLKSFITRPTMQVERKGYEPYTISDYNNFILVTNNMLPIKIEPSDRRYLTLEVSNKMANNREYFKPLAASLNDTCGEHFFHYLASIDITDFEYNRIPSTKLKDELKMYSLPPPILFLIDIVNGEILCCEIDDVTNRLTLKQPSSVLYSIFNGWATSRNFKQINMTGFVREIKKIIEPGRFYVSGVQMRGYNITLDELKKRCIEYVGAGTPIGDS